MATQTFILKISPQAEAANCSSCSSCFAKDLAKQHRVSTQPVAVSFCIAWIFTRGIFEAYCCECRCCKALTSAPCVCVHFAMTTCIRLHLADRDTHKHFQNCWAQTYVWRDDVHSGGIANKCGLLRWWYCDLCASFYARTQTQQNIEENIICEEAASIHLCKVSYENTGWRPCTPSFWSEFQV